MDSNFNPEPWFESYNLAAGLTTARPIIDIYGTGYSGIFSLNGNSGGMGSYICKKDSADNVLQRPTLLTKITDGMDVVTKIEYNSISGWCDDMYKGHTSNYGLDEGTTNYQGAYYVVSNVEKSSGIGNYREYCYSYKGAKVNNRGYGFLGFENITVNETYSSTSYRITSTLYHQAFPYIGLYKNLRTSIENPGGSCQVSKMTYGYEYSSYQNKYRVKWKSTSTRKYDYPSGELLSKTWKYVWSYDDYGNPLHVTEDVRMPDDTYIHVDHYTMTYDNRDESGQWIIGLPLTLKFQQSYDFSNGYRTLNKEFQYNDEGSLWNDIIEPDSTDEDYLRTTYLYDDFGNMYQTLFTYKTPGNTICKLMFNCEYDNRGQFMEWMDNAEWHRTDFLEWDIYFGRVEELKDPNGLYMEMWYDNFGRVKEIEHTDDTLTTFTYDFYGPFNYHIKTETGGNPTVDYYYDKLGRLRETQYAGYGGDVYAVAFYDKHGRVIKQSQPYFDGDSQYFTEYDYDILNRVTKVEVPVNEAGVIAETDYSYSGFDITVTDPLGHISKIRRNALGQIVEFENALDKITTFEYDSSGNLIKQTDPANIVTEWNYDIRNRMISHDDPNSGDQTFMYNGIDHLIQIVDAKDQEFIMEYDDLGRMTLFDRPDGYDEWVYDNPDNGIGSLWKTSCVNDDSGLVSSEIYTFDNLARVKTKKTTIVPSQSFTFTFSYDGYSRLSKMTYPTGLKLIYDYDSNGYNTKISKNTMNIPLPHPNSGTTIKDGDGGKGYLPTASSMVWELEEMNAFGQITQEKYGNDLITKTDVNKATGRVENIVCPPDELNPWNMRHSDFYHYDLNGNIDIRSGGYMKYSGWTAWYEGYTYDELNRLTSVNGQPIVYDADSGNILEKFDVFSANSPQPIYLYSAEHPNAVERIQETYVGAPLFRTFDYDDNGNMVLSADYDTYNQIPFYNEITYNSFDMPTEIIRRFV
jgi:YD repeat-containing protein